MPDIKLLAEKYQVVQENKLENVVNQIDVNTLLEHFVEMSKESNDVLTAFSKVYIAQAQGKELMRESVVTSNEDIKLAILCIEKILNHLKETEDENFCLKFESIILESSNVSKDLGIVLEAEGGFLSKVGKGITNFAKGVGKAGSAVGKGIVNTATGVGSTVGKAVGGLAGGLVGGAISGAKSAYSGASASGGGAGSGSGAGSNDKQDAAKDAAADAAAGLNTPQAAQQSQATVTQINASIGKIKRRDLLSIKKNIEARLAALDAKAGASTPVAAATTAPAGKPPAAAGKQPAAAVKQPAAESIIKEYYIINNKHFRK